MAIKYNPADFTGNLFDYKPGIVDHAKLKPNDLLIHMEGKGKGLLPFTSSFAGTKVRGTNLMDDLKELVRVDHTGESFRIEHEKLAEAMHEIENHERVLKASNGTQKYLTEAQLKKHAEKVYKEAGKVKEKALKINVELNKSTTGMYDKLKTFNAYHTTELSKGAGELDGLIQKAIEAGTKTALTDGYKISDLKLDSHAEGLLCNMTGKAPAGSITLKEYEKAQELFSTKYEASYGRIGELMTEQTEGMTKMIEHIDKEVIAKTQEVTGIAPSAAAIKAGASTTEIITKEAGELAKTAEDATRLGMSKTTTETFGQKFARRWNTSEVTYNKEGIITDFKKVGAPTKFMKGAAIAAGTVAGLHGLYKLASPGVDENGKPMEVEVMPQLLKVGGGVGLVLLGLLTGGKVMGI